MTAAVLLDHVSAYAAAVRSHLRDLSPEQVDDLTDGLEADLVDALEDGPALGPDDADAGSRPIDLTHRFGPAADYAAELRAAAGLAPVAAPTQRFRQVLAERRRARRERVRARFDRWTRPVTSHRSWPAVRSFVASLEPAWWLLRAWVWFVVVAWLLQVVLGTGQVFVPEGLATWLLLLALVVLSVNLGRGTFAVPARARRALRVASVGAAVLALPLLLGLADRVESYAAGWGYTEVVRYEQTPVADGVWVDGMQVSNLFVYDADGEPLTGVQVVDDRGRPVRTIADGWEEDEWHLPGVEEPWRFVPAVTADGRPRWNVYPLRGAPVALGDWDEYGSYVLPDTVEPQDPPAPFAKAPAVLVPGAAPAPDDDAPAPEDTGSGATEGSTGTADPDTSSPDGSAEESGTADGADPTGDVAPGPASTPTGSAPPATPPTESSTSGSGG